MWVLYHIKLLEPSQQEEVRIDMPELQNENDGEPERLPKKLTWDEIGVVMKRGWWNRASKKYQKSHPDRAKENTRKQNLKKNLKRQREHPNEIISKKKYWIVSVKKT